MSVTSDALLGSDDPGPALAEIGRPIDPGSHVSESVPIKSGVGGAGVESAWLQRRPGSGGGRGGGSTPAPPTPLLIGTPFEARPPRAIPRPPSARAGPRTPGPTRAS